MRNSLIILSLFAATSGCVHARLTTDHTAYQPSDTIELKLTNLGMRSVGYNLCVSHAEEEVGGEWTPVPFPRYVCPAILRILKPFRSSQFLISLDGELPPGTYRLTTDLEAPLGTEQWPIHTQPFEVLPVAD